MSNRTEVIERDYGIECRIASWKIWSHIIIWPLAIPFWIAAVVDTITSLNNKIGHGIGMYIWIVVWISFGCLFTIEWLRLVFGREVITVNEDRLTIRREIIPDLGFAKSFDISKISNFSTREPFGPPKMWKIMILGFTAKEDYQKYGSRGSIGFEYEGKTRLFGPQLDEEESTCVYEELRVYLPESAMAPR